MRAYPANVITRTILSTLSISGHKSGVGGTTNDPIFFAPPYIDDTALPMPKPLLDFCSFWDDCRSTPLSSSILECAFRNAGDIREPKVTFGKPRGLKMRVTRTIELGEKYSWAAYSTLFMKYQLFFIANQYLLSFSSLRPHPRHKLCMQK